MSLCRKRHDINSPRVSDNKEHQNQLILMFPSHHTMPYVLSHESKHNLINIIRINTSAHGTNKNKEKYNQHNKHISKHKEKLLTYVRDIRHRMRRDQV